uniref:Uncharacterized protein LOC114344098 isoform X2 n=1 Tax=Diabrotica virgifera virgifera TaxID=50390 RepID=A0A6P7GZ90_DIAVI
MEVKQELTIKEENKYFLDTTCKVEIYANKVDVAALDTFKSEIKEEPNRESPDYLDLKEVSIKTEIEDETKLMPFEEKQQNEKVERRLFQNEEKFREYFRLCMDLFETVLRYIRDDITKKPYKKRQHPISAEEKLSVTLRYLVTGASFRSLAFQYRIHHSWISVLVKEVLENIESRTLHIYIPEPSKGQMKTNVQDFYYLWNYPNCCASIDGKHIRILCPNKAGSLFFNYKNYHSVVLLALVDARYRFVAIDVGSYGRKGDAGIFSKSVIKQKIDNGNFNIPSPSNIPGTNIIQPHVILGDEAFSLTTTMMKHYPQSQTTYDKTKAVYN